MVFGQERPVERVFEVFAARAAFAAHAEVRAAGDDEREIAGLFVQPGPLPRIQRRNGEHDSRLEHMFDKCVWRCGDRVEDMDEIQWAEALRGFSFDASDTLTPERPNVFRIAGFPQREQVSSNMLAWLFDPQGNHGLGALAVETLLSLIGRTDATADEATVETEVTTDGGKRIDILVCTADLAIAVENKVDAWLYNDLADYRAHAAKTNGTEAVVVVLSPHHQENLDEYEKQGLVVDGNLFEVLYDKLFTALLARLGNRIMNAEPRGVDLLMQYIDNYSAERNENVMKEENDAIRRFTESTRHIGREIIAFRQTFDEYVEASKRILIQGFSFAFSGGGPSDAYDSMPVSVRSVGTACPAPAGRVW